MSENFVLRQIVGLIDLGHEVKILARTCPAANCIHEDVKKYDLLQKVYYIPSIPQNKIKRRLKTLAMILWGGMWHPMDMGRLLRDTLGRGLGCESLYYGWLLLGKRFDIAHGHFGPFGKIAAVIKSAGLARRAVATFHGFDVTAYIRSHGADVYKELFVMADALTYNSERTAGIIRDLGACKEKMVKIPMGIEMSSIPYREKNIEKGQTIRILSVGRLVEMKGRRYAIEAVASAMENYPDIEYHIIGDGELRAELDEQIRNSGFADRIFLHGWVTDEELDMWYRESHIFLHPSVTSSDGNQEGQGVVLVEAQAYGLVVIATLHGAFPETVPEGCGFLVPERDAQAILTCLKDVLATPECWPAITMQARKNAEKYEISHLNNRLEELYLDLLA